MHDRGSSIDGFLARTGWTESRAEPLAGDASSRSYLRLHRDNGTAVLMDAPPDRCDPITPYLHVTTHLAGLGISVPLVFASDTERGLILLEDLGSLDFLHAITDCIVPEMTLYMTALDTLATFQSARPPASLRVWDAAHMAEVLRPVFDESSGGPASFDRWRETIADCLARLDSVPSVFCHRDFHAGNLFWLPDRDGPARVGVIDHQDAFAGHPAYDLVSLITDARRDLAPNLAEALIHRWLDLTGGSDTQLRADLPLLIGQRNLRVFGVLMRLARTGRPHYAAFLPRVRRHLVPALAAIPALAPLADELLP